MTLNRSLLACLGLVAVFAAGCGDDDGDATPETTSPDTVEETDPEAEAGESEVGATAEGGDDAEPVDDESAVADEPEADAVDVDDPEVDTPDATVPAADEPDAADPQSTTTQPADVGIPADDAAGENEGGVPIELDETASLACANAEFARDALNAEDVAAALRFLADAADRAEPSAVSELADLAGDLREADEEVAADAVITEVLDICVERGHQI